MNIAVLFKQVPDTEASIKPDTSRPGAILETDIKFVLNPYDEYAIEEALRITERSGGEAVGFCIGPQRAEPAIRNALAMGLHRAVWIADPEAVEADAVTQGRILAEAVRSFAPRLILCGREMIDTQEDALAPAVAHFLDLPHAMNASRITLDDDKALVVRDMDGLAVEIEIRLPAAISCSKDLNDPRYPTLIAIKRAKTKEIKRLTLAELGVRPGPSKTRITALVPPPPRPKGTRVEGEPPAVVAQSMEWLGAVAKVI